MHCCPETKSKVRPKKNTPGTALAAPGGFFFWTRFENLVAKGRKINDRVTPILEAYVIEMTSYACQDRSEKVAEFAQCVAPCRLKLSRLSNYTQKMRG